MNNDAFSLFSDKDCISVISETISRRLDSHGGVGNPPVQIVTCTIKTDILMTSVVQVPIQIT